MRIVKKQHGGEVNNTPRKNPRYVVGHPLLTGGKNNTQNTYNELERRYNEFPLGEEEGYPGNIYEQRMNPTDPNNSISRQIIGSAEGWAPNDTIYTQNSANLNPKTGAWLLGVSRQAGVIHSNNYDGSRWSGAGNNKFTPKVINGVPHYYDPKVGQYVPVEKYQLGNKVRNFINNNGELGEPAEATYNDLQRRFRSVSQGQKYKFQGYPKEVRRLPDGTMIEEGIFPAATPELQDTVYTEARPKVNPSYPGQLENGSFGAVIHSNNQIISNTQKIVDGKYLTKGPDGQWRDQYGNVYAGM